MEMASQYQEKSEAEPPKIPPTKSTIAIFDIKRLSTDVEMPESKTNKDI